MLSSNIKQDDFFLEMSRGNLPGKTYFHASSLVGSINNVEIVVRVEDTVLSAFVFPSNAGESMEIVSSSINDVAVTGSGCRTVNIGYLDIDFLEQTLTVSLNGTTPVALVPINPLKPIARINRMAGMTFGTGNISAGNIDVRKVGTTTSNIYRRIATGDSRAKSSVFTVPANKGFFLQEWHFAASAATAGHFANFKLWTNGEASVFPVLGSFTRSIILGLCQDAHVVDDFPIPLRFLPRSDIYCSVVSDAGGAAVTAITEYYGWFETI